MRLRYRLDMDLDAIRADLDAEGVLLLSRHQYERLVEVGVLADARVELLFGRMVPMSPQGWAHAHVVEQLVYSLMGQLGDRARVRAHSPMAASEASEPEPDVLVFPPDAAVGTHPTRAWLAIQVADTSLRKDRSVKAALYALADVPEYWVVDLKHRCVHVHRGPTQAGYASIVQVPDDGVLDVSAFPDVQLAVPSLLPPE